MKSLIEAVQIRNYVIKQFEESLLLADREEIKSKLTFVIVGGGPTGVEMAGAISELRKYILPKDYPELPLDCMDIYLVEMGPRLLPTMSEFSSAKALEGSQRLGVKVLLNTAVKEYDGQTLLLGNGEKIATKSLIWAAGVKGIPIKGFDKEILLPNGRIMVNEYCQVKGFDNILAIGDIAQMTNDPRFPRGYPMVAQVAIQQGKLVAGNLVKRLQGRSMQPFKYKDLGSLATIGRNKAVAEIGKTKLGGRFAWFIWMAVHLMSLLGFRNKMVVLTNWIYRYFTFDRGTRIIIKRGAANIVKLRQSVLQPEQEEVS
jgi:NADH dehydrogenase